MLCKVETAFNTVKTAEQFGDLLMGRDALLFLLRTSAQPINREKSFKTASMYCTVLVSNLGVLGFNFVINLSCFSEHSEGFVTYVTKENKIA